MPGRATGVDRFDLIIFNHDQVQTFANLGGDFAIVHEGGMLVNTGTQPITALDLIRPPVTVTKDNPQSPVQYSLSVMVDELTPIMPGEAVLCGDADSDMVRQLLQPGETLRSVCPTHTIGYSVRNLAYPGVEGPVSFQVSLSIGGQTVHFPVTFDVQRIPDPETWTPLRHAGVIRVSSDGTIAAKPTTWGKLKVLYR